MAVLRKVDVILAAASPRNDYSAALETARPHLRPETRLLRLEFPMTRDALILRAAWQKAAQAAREVLEGGESAAFLTIGDPLIYSTFGYLLRTLRESAPKLPVEIVPGITSFQAAAARTGTVLCEGRETLRILPGINGREDLAQELRHADTAVILKAYRNFPAISEALRSASRSGNCLLASHVEQPEESIQRDIGAVDSTPPYMSLILSRNPESDTKRKH